ncbi:MAG: TRAP transporter substrate-binding protein [Parvibaculaceae bacterium]|nr:TRAP transporter substrate-binding protein [Parvibaculaceae bacterium]
MKRRSFLAGAGLTGLAAATLPAPALAQGKRQLKMVTTWPKNYPGLGVSAERLATRIREMTDGQIDIKVFAANELVPPLECFDTVSSGAADIYHGAEYYWQGKSKAFNFFTAVPFGMTAAEINAWIYHGGGQELWDELSARFKIKAFMCANTGVQLPGWYRREIKSLDDLKGLSIRMPGLGGEVMRRLGAASVTLAGPDIFPALQNRTIDAAEWVGPWNDMAFGFYRLAKYYYWPGFHEPGSSLAAGFNLDVWNSLTKQQQAVVRAACAAENDYTLAEYNAHNGEALKTLIEKHGVLVRRFPDDVVAALKKTSLEVLEDAAKEDAFTAKVYESFRNFLDTTSEWTRIGDEGFVEARRD